MNAPHTKQAEKSDALRLDAVAVFKRWLEGDKRLQLYDERIKTGRDCLKADLQLWSQQLASEPESMISHHVEQFSHFVDSALGVLVDEPLADAVSIDPAEARDFYSLVVGVLTAQWLLLREAATQRASGPYRDGLKELDGIVRGYYARLHKVCDKDAFLDFEQVDARFRSFRLAGFPPLTHLGRAMELKVFNRRVPLMLSIPFGSLPGDPDSERTRMAIPHEVAHTLFAQVPELLEQIQNDLRSTLTSSAGKHSDRERVLFDMALGWTEEICADLVGTALAGPVFADSARWVLAGPDSMIGTTDGRHPPAALRPMVHLLALRALDQHASGSGTSAFDGILADLEGEIHTTRDVNLGGVSRMNRQYRAVPALLFVTMEDVSNVLKEMVQRILEAKPKVLNGSPVIDLLAAIRVAPESDLPDTALDKWGEINVDRDSLVILFSASAPPTFGTPGIAAHPLCCDNDFWRPICCF